MEKLPHLLDLMMDEMGVTHKAGRGHRTIYVWSTRESDIRRSGIIKRVSLLLGVRQRIFGKLD